MNFLAGQMRDGAPHEIEFLRRGVDVERVAFGRDNRTAAESRFFVEGEQGEHTALGNAVIGP